MHRRIPAWRASRRRRPGHVNLLERRLPESLPGLQISAIRPNRNVGPRRYTGDRDFSRGARPEPSRAQSVAGAFPWPGSASCSPWRYRVVHQQRDSFAHWPAAGHWGPEGPALLVTRKRNPAGGIRLGPGNDEQIADTLLQDRLNPRAARWNLESRQVTLQVLRARLPLEIAE
jgi:hypothetical protein